MDDRRVHLIEEIVIKALSAGLCFRERQIDTGCLKEWLVKKIIPASVLQIPLVRFRQCLIRWKSEEGPSTF